MIVLEIASVMLLSTIEFLFGFHVAVIVGLSLILGYTSESLYILQKGGKQ